MTVGAVAAALLVPAPAGAAPASPGGLAPTGEVASSTPTLSWSRVSGAARYEVQLEAAAGGWDNAVSTVNNRYVPTQVLRNGSQDWRVRAVSSSNDPSGWSTATISVTRGGAPAPIGPTGGEVLSQPQEPPLLEWSAVPGATSYVVEVAPLEDSTFTSAQRKEYKTQVASLVVPDPLTERDYHWRVKAQRSLTGSYQQWGGQTVDSDWSAPSAFQVEPLQPVTITSPDDNPDNAVEDVVLDWEPVPGAQFYQVRVSTDADFTDSGVIDNQTKVLGTRYSPKTTYDNNQYYWQVRAVDLNGQPTPWSQVQANFDRVWPDRPEPLYPLGTAAAPTAVSDPMYFQWSPVQHATQYELQVGGNPNFSPGTYDTCQVAGTTYTPGLFSVNDDSGQISTRPDEGCNPDIGITNYWRVRPLDRPFNRNGALVPGVQGIFSAGQAFVHQSKAFAAGGFSPTNGAVVDIPTLSWSPVEGVESYMVEIFDNAMNPVQTNKKTYATSYTPVGLFAPLSAAKSPYTWTVRAVESDGRVGSLIHQRTFSVTDNLPATTPSTGDDLTPLSANGTTTVRAPKMTWEPMAGATTYKVFAGPELPGNTLFTSNFSDAFGKVLHYPAVTDTWTHFLEPGRYSWYVQGYDRNNVLLGRGPTATFTVSELAPVTGQQIALDGLSLDNGQVCVGRVSDPLCPDAPASPVFDWDPVDGAGMYMVYVSEDASFTNIVEQRTNVPATVNTRWAPTIAQLKSVLGDSQAGGAYYWFVRPCKNLTVCGPSPISQTGMATNKFRKKSPAVLPTSPVDGATVTSTEITLDWQDYRTTNESSVWAATGERSTQSAMWYRVQIDDNANFSSPLESVEVDQSTFTSAAKLYPEGPLYWRVQAIDADGNDLTWSTPRSIVKRSPGPSLQRPGVGAVVDGTTPFRWAPQAFAGGYELEVAKNADENFSDANLLFRQTGIKNSAFSWDKPIPAAGTAYAWRVRRRDAAGNVGPWSSVRFFTSRGDVPSLQTPVSGADVQANAGFFTWHGVAGATSYKLEVRQAGAGYSWAAVQTPATAWAADRLLSDGSWQWRVQARDSGGNLLGETGWWSFAVDGSQPTVRSYSPTYGAKRNANVKVVFSEPVVKSTVTRTSFQLRKQGSTTPLAGAVTLSSDRLRATFNPTALLKRGKTYKAVVKSTIRDPKGNRLVAKSWSFTVQ